MSRRTIRILDLLCDATNLQRSINTVQKDVNRYEKDEDCLFLAEARDEARRWSLQRDKIAAKIRATLEQLDERERQYLIKTSNHDLDVKMREIGIELPWWRNRLLSEEKYQ